MTLSAVPSTISLLALQTANTSNFIECTDPLKTDLSSEIRACWHLREAFLLAQEQFRQASHLQESWRPHQEGLATVNLLLEHHLHVEFPQGMLKLLQQGRLKDIQHQARQRKEAHQQLQERLRHLTVRTEELQAHLQALTRWLVLKEDLEQQGFSHKMKLLLPQYRAEQQRKQNEAQTLERDLQPLMAELGTTTVEQGWQACHSRLQGLLREKEGLLQRLQTAPLTSEEKMVLTFPPSQLEHFQAAFDATEALKRHDRLLREIQHAFPHIQSLPEALQESSAVNRQVSGLSVALDLLEKPNLQQWSTVQVFPKTRHKRDFSMLMETVQHLPHTLSEPEVVSDAVLPTRAVQQELLEVLVMRHVLLAQKQEETEVAETQDAKVVNVETLLLEPFAGEDFVLEEASPEQASAGLTPLPAVFEELEDPVFLDPSEGQHAAFAESADAHDEDIVDEVFLKPVSLFEQEHQEKPSHQPDLGEAAEWSSSGLLFFEVEEVQVTDPLLESTVSANTTEPLDSSATVEPSSLANSLARLLPLQAMSFFGRPDLLTPGWLSQLQQARQVTEKALHQATRRLRALEDIVQPLQQLPAVNLVHVPAVLRPSLPGDLLHLRKQALERQQLWQTLHEKRKAILQDIQHIEAVVSEFGTLELLNRQVSELQQSKGPLTPVQRTVLARKQKALARLQNALQVHWKPGHKNHQQACLHQQKELEKMLASVKTLQVALDACAPSEQDTVLINMNRSQLQDCQQAFQKTANFQTVQQVLDHLLEMFPGTRPHRWQVLHNHLQEEVQGLTRRMEVLSPQNHLPYEPLNAAVWKSTILWEVSRTENPVLDVTDALPGAAFDLEEVQGSEWDGADLQDTILQFDPQDTLENAAGVPSEVSGAAAETPEWMDEEPFIDLLEPFQAPDPALEEHEGDFEDLEFESGLETPPEPSSDEDPFDLWNLDDLGPNQNLSTDLDPEQLTSTRLAEQRAAELAFRHDVRHGFDFLAEALDLQIVGKRAFTLQKLLAAGHAIEEIELAYRTRLLVGEAHAFWYRWVKYGELRATPFLLSWEHALKFVSCFHGLPDLTEIELTLQAVVDLHAAHPWFRQETSACFVLIHLIRTCPPHTDINVYVHHLLEAL